MGRELKTVTFESLVQANVLQIGDGFRAKNEELGGDGGHVPSGRSRPRPRHRFPGVERFHTNLAEKVAGKMARPGDAVITTKGNSTGRVCFIRDDMPQFVYSPHLTYWRSMNRDILDPRFLYYWSRSNEFQTQLQGMSASTDMAPYLSLGDQRRLRITLPPISDQRRSSKTLGTLDDMIELNRQMNETLEVMAQAIFQSWFVDFDPVRAKANGRKPAGMSKEFAALYPDSFEKSELGDIPKGWRVRPLPEVCDVNPTRSLSKGTVAPSLDMAYMPTQGPSPESWVQREMGSGMKFIHGDTLVARITPCLENGKTAFVDFLSDSQVGWGSTEYIVLRPKGAIPPVFAYLLPRTNAFRTFAIQQMTGSSGRQRVPADSLSKYLLVTPEPSNRLFELFGKLVTPLFLSITAAMHLTRTLAALRDALLPTLISGELRVPDLELIVGRAV